MSDELHTQGCATYADDLAALALGALTGRDRATVLVHVEGCPRCADELEQLVRAADAVVRVAPEMEPPLGFESRLFSRMGVVDAPPVLHPRWSRSRWVLAAAALVVALAVGLGIGLSTGSPVQGPSQSLVTPPAGMPVAAADLIEGGSAVGQVFTYGGSTPWMFMTLADSSAHGRVICQVVTKDGVTHRVGSFMAKKGYGAWGAPLPVTPQDVRRAEVVTPSGTVIATATLSS